MDFLGYDCAGCNKPFHADDDIVVCPICGTPQHRDCYEKLGHCVNEEKHSTSYFWKENITTESVEDSSDVSCPNCGYKNKCSALFCNHCGKPLNSENTTAPPTYNNVGAGFNGLGGIPFPTINPEEMYNSDAEFTDNISVKEMATFVGQSKPYYLTVFNRIKSFGSSRFNFCAFFLSGGWMLYRKQYLKGAIVSILMVACLIFSALYSNYFFETARTIMNQNDITSLSSMNQMLLLSDCVSKLNFTEQLMFYISPVCDLLRLCIMFFCGATANRGYYKFCVNKIHFIKGTSSTIVDSVNTTDIPTNSKAETPVENSHNILDLLKNAGGVNFPLAIVLLVCQFIINYLTVFLAQ